MQPIERLRVLVVAARRIASATAASANALGSTPPPCCSTLSRARSRSCSRLPPRATPMTGTSSVPRRIIACSAGKIFLNARSPVAPRKTNASDRSAAMGRGLLHVTAERQAHRRQQPVLKIRVAARCKPREQRRGEHVHGHRLLRSPPESSSVLRRSPTTCPLKPSSVGSLAKRARGQIEQPGSDHAAAPPDLGDRRHIEVVLVILGMRAAASSRRRRRGVSAPTLACFRTLNPSA